VTSVVSLVGCFVVLTAFSSWVLLAPSKSVALILDIIDLTYRFRFELLAIIIVNIVCCFAFERYAERPLARLVGTLRKWARGKRGGKHNRGRVVSGKAYKAVESNL
jgi:cation-transporting ATPase 13A2